MVQLNNPFDESAFSKQDSVLLDACILLSLLDDEGIFYDNCKMELEKLNNKDVKFYVSNVVLSEVINRSINDLFINDVKFIWNGYKPLNSKENIKSILNIMKKEHFEMLVNPLTEPKNFIKIPFSMYFNKISKDKTSLDRNILAVYYSEAINMIDELERKYDLSTLIINENMMNSAKDYTKTYCLGINDSQHLATAMGHRVKYLMTTDSDFNFIPKELKVKLLKVNK